jgi:hypothetical protein
MCDGTSLCRDIVRDMKNIMIPSDRAHRVVIGIRIEHLEYVPRRMAGTFTSISIVKHRFFELSRDIVRDMKNIMIPSDRAHRVVLETRTEHLEHVPKRIVGGITRIGC